MISCQKNLQINKFLFFLPVIFQVLFCVNICRGVSTNVTGNSSFEEIKEELDNMNIPVLTFEFDDNEFPTYEVVEHPEGCWGKSIINNEYVKGSLIMTLGGEEIYNSGEFLDKESGVKVKYRGNTSTAQDYITKKSFKIKLSKKADLLFREDKKYKDKEWILLNGNKDINYVIGTQIARICGMEWEPEGKSVCVIMNGQYIGYYYLVEAVKASEARVDIQDSGFIIENDAYWWKPDELYFKTVNLPYSAGWTFKEPDPDDIDDLTLEQIKNLIQAFENSLYAHEEINEMYDKESFANWLLAHDILGTVDSGGSNIFVTKEDYNGGDLFSTKLKMGPLWDFDDCFRSADDVHANIFNDSFFWYKQLLMYGDFYETVIKNWNEVKDVIIDKLKPLVEDYLNDNPEIYKARLIDSRLNLLGGTSFTNPQSDYERKLKWLENRLTAIDNLYKNILPAKIIINALSIEMKEGENTQLEAIVYPENATEQNIIWSTSDPQIVTVSEEGIVKAVSEGVAVVTAECGSVSATCKVTVLNPIIEPKEIVLNLEETEIVRGETVQLKATVLPMDTTDPTVKWQSSDNSVATVSENGLIKAVSEGVAVVIATCKDITAFCKITVVKPIIEATQVILNLEEAEIVRGETVQLQATVLPFDTTDPTVKWQSSDNSVATVSENGLVEAVSEGEAIITAISGSSKALCEIKVKPVIASAINLDIQQIILLIGETKQILATVYPENTTDKTVIWKSSNEEVATISDAGVVLANSEGMALITATCGEVSAIAFIDIHKPIIEAEEIILNCQEAEIKVGETLQLEATVLPEDTTDPALTWISSDEGVVTVSDDGILKAISAGEAIITATCGEVSAECHITVIDNAGVESLLANPDSKISVYSIDGILIKKDCETGDLKLLSKGIYIIVSGKDRYKISL